MGVIVKKVELSFWDRLYVISVAKGMGITFKHFVKQLLTPTSKRYTIQYPEMKKTMPKGYRPERFLAWCRWMRIYRRTYVSAFAKR